MWFKLLMLIHLCAAFPLKCPETAQWALRANSLCADPSKYFCLRNDLINGYSENCTRSDFQQPGRKAVLRGGIDADICSKERYQPFPLRFYTNVSTHCLFFKSFCNEEGQVVYDRGNRNTDTTCRCDYRRGYDFLVKPNNLCFCKPQHEDCSCYLKTCSNKRKIFSPDYDCLDKMNRTVVTQCRPITDDKDNSSERPVNIDIIPLEDNVFFLVPWKKNAAMVVVVLIFCTRLVLMLVLFRTLIKRLILRHCCRVYFIDDQAGEIKLYEGQEFCLRYHTSRWKYDVKIYKQLQNSITLPVHHYKIKKYVTTEDSGWYHAECHGVKSQYTWLTVQRMLVICLTEIVLFSHSV